MNHKLNKQKLVICDVSRDLYPLSTIFNSEIATSSPGMGFWRLVKNDLELNGISVVSSDTFLSNLEEYENYQKFLVSDMINTDTERLIELGSQPIILLCLESPNVALKFHNNLPTYTSKYKHTILFGGLRKYVNQSTEFHKLYWPNHINCDIPNHTIWSAKKFLVMVASNKRRFDVAINRPLLPLRRVLKKGYVQLIKATNPLFKFEDLYAKRSEAILHFSNVEGFALYGTLWDKPHGLSSKYYNAAKKLNPTRVDSKHAVLAQYKFNLCFENCVYPGYVTEKIFDCLLAGTIPVYFGAPDIADFVPKDCYLDFRDYGNFKDLQHALESMTEEEASKYLDAASHFVNSEAFMKYTTQNFSELFNKILIKEIGSHT